MNDGIFVEWINDREDFNYDSYTRNHQWHFSNGVDVPVSAAPGFLGDPDCINPEQGVTASLSSCHMLTFLAIAAKKKRILKRYEDHPQATMEKQPDGTTEITRIVLRPKVVVEGEPLTLEELEKLHASAHKYCFVANSLKSEVIIKPVVAAHT